MARQPQALCPPGYVEDYDPATGEWLGTCVADTQAYQQGPMYHPPAPGAPAQGQPYYNAGNLGTVNVSAGAGAGIDSTTLMLIAGGVFLFFMMRRR